MDVEHYRESFPALAGEGRIHLNNCSASPVPERVLAARRECERVWVEAANPWEEWLDRVESARARFARLIGADPDEVAVVGSVTDALGLLASALDYEGRDEVVVSDLEFPTVPQFWRGQRRRGATVRVAESPDGVVVPAGAYADAIGDDTLLVCSAHAYSFTGGLLDVRAVADAVHDRGGHLVLDAYQSLGVVPVDVEAMDVDVLVAGTLKFLLGPPGIAFCYVDRALAERLEPADRGWFGVEDVFAFETRDPGYADGARRFQRGTPPATAAYAADAGMHLIAEVGVDAVRERVAILTERLVAGVTDRGFAVRTPRDPERRGGVVNVQVADPEEAVDALEARGFALSARGGGIRLSPHFYTTTDEIDRAIEAVDDVARPAD